MNKIVLITGASKGLGYFLVENFLKKDYIVLATYRRDEELLKTINHHNLRLFQMDVSEESSVKNCFEEIRKIYYKIDIIVNNAAIYLEGKKPTPPITDIDIENVITTYNVNAVGALRVLKYFYPMVLKSEDKLIINISSEAGSIADCWRDREFGYCMSKAALNMLTKILSIYGKKDNVKVFSIHPGWMRTDMGGKEADISPEEAAIGIVKFVSSPAANHEFYDYTGKPMNW
ncbi:MAG: SDR family oxidoreductase [Brevinematales bacterium]|nr:SDR family oxidoreductase [Brevinematales bacterium]